MRAIALALLLAGCAGDVWQKPGASQADFNKAEYLCQRDALQNGDLVVASGAVRRTSDHNLYRMCMQAHGFSRVR